jgi:hypothetical protein
MTTQIHTLKTLSDFAWRLRQRCTMRGGELAEETLVMLNREDAEAIVALQERLDAMVPHANEIRRVVTGR